ncbi:MAG: hypothetical protein OXU81_08735, partial [Gammaproteobacteria bacterium]|nr:hypothetical protein [Gammaproteobacteria bacterium]
MPSSRVDVQTAVVAGCVFNRFARSIRCSRDRLAWCGKNSTGRRASSDIALSLSAYLNYDNRYADLLFEVVTR